MKQRSTDQTSKLQWNHKHVKIVRNTVEAKTSWKNTKANERLKKAAFPGGTPIWNRRGCSSEILNLTRKGDHLGVAQAFCDS